MSNSYIDKVTNIDIEIKEKLSLGWWEWNMVTNKLVWDEGMFNIYEEPITENLDYTTYSSHVDDYDLINIENDLQVSKETGENFVSVFKINVKSGIKYIRAYGVVSGKKMIGINIEIDKSEYFCNHFCNQETPNLCIVQHKLIRDIFYQLKKTFQSPYKFIPKMVLDTWTPAPQDLIKNTKYRVLSIDNTSHLIVEWLSMNGVTAYLYHANDILITNMGDAVLNVTVNGDTHALQQTNNVHIPAGRFYKIQCEGICNYMTTWFDYYVKGSKTLR